MAYTGNLFSSDPGICVPVRNALSCSDDSGCGADTPLCVRYSQGTAGNCFTEPELDCACQAQLGSTAIVRCPSTLQAGRACITRGGKCDQVPCCSGEICKPDATGQPVCLQACTADSECTTGCCTIAANATAGVCGAAMDCCVSQSGDCSAGNHPCCAGSMCTNAGTSPATCKKMCVADADCGAGCCLPVNNTSYRVCETPENCGSSSTICKSQVGAACDTVACCTGLACVTPNGTDPFACQPVCTQSSDCATNCCVAISDAGYSACLPASSCCTSQVGAACVYANECCAGLACVGLAGTGTLTCQPICTQSSDCATNCCAPIPGLGYSACSPAVACG